MEDVLNAPPPDRVEPSHVQIYNGENTLYSVCPSVPQVALMLNQGNKVGGKDYHDAGGFLRLTANYDGSNGVGLRVVPEIHHGPIRHGYVADASTSPVRRPAVRRPRRAAGRTRCATWPPRSRWSRARCSRSAAGPIGELSLGHFLFTAAEANSDRLLQKVLLVRAHQVHSDPMSIGTGTAPEPVPSPTSLN